MAESPPDAPVNTFRSIPAPKGDAFEDAFVKSSLHKWDITRGSQVHRFAFTSSFHRMAPEQFLRELFGAAEVQAALCRSVTGGPPLPLSGAIADVQWDHVTASETSMALFDRLEACDPPIARPGGRLTRCADEEVGGVVASDELRKMLLLGPESEHAELYSQAERGELLFRTFEHLALGGSMTQFEDSCAPYLEAAKRIYKSLVSVRKSQAGAIEVVSAVYAVKGLTTAEGWTLFPAKPPGKQRQNFCYVCVDQMRYRVTIWYHAFKPVW